MRIDYCKYIIGVADLGSITQAAERFFISQQGLSQAIKSVEKELDTILFRRIGNQMLPTAAGQVALTHMRRILTEYDEMHTSLSAMRAGQKQPEAPLTILAPYNVVNSILPTVLNLLLQSVPHLLLNIREESAPDIPQLPGYDENTLAILCIPDFLLEGCEKIRSGEMVFEEYARGPLMGLVSSMSPLSSMPYIPNSQLCSLPLAGQQAEMLMARRVIGDDECELDTFMTVSKFSLYRSMIAKGLAVGFTSTVLERFTKPQALTLVPLERKIDILWGCVYSREHPPGLAATNAMLLTKSILSPPHNTK